MRLTHSIGLATCLSLLSLQSASSAVVFTEPFSPAEGMVAAVEKPLRQEICLNGTWDFQPVFVPSSWVQNMGVAPELPEPGDDWESTPIRIPSPWNVNSWGNGRNVGEGTERPYVADSVYYPSYPSSWEGIEMGWLRRIVTLPEEFTGKRIILHFEAVAGEAQVLVNGHSAGEAHFDSFLPFEYDITDLLQPGENEVLVGVRKSRLFDKTTEDYPQYQRRTYPNGSYTDNLVGIWGDVYLWALPSARVDSVFVKPQVSLNELAVEVLLRNDSERSKQMLVAGSVSPWINLAGSDALSAPVPKWKLGSPVLDLPVMSIELEPGEVKRIELKVPVDGALNYWSPDTPNLYGLVLSLTDASGKTVDCKYTRFGWREFAIEGSDLYLNGEKIQLWGDFTHPFGPYVSSRRFVWGFYSMIKDMHANSVRPHANVMPRIWAEMADEMGLCLLAETSIFGSSINLNLKEDITWERFDRHLDDLILRDRNHPSVFGWSPANEMFALFFETNETDTRDQYQRLNAFSQRAFRLDPTRDWVSVDGDKDLEGTLPVWSRHIGIGLPNDLPGTEKPRMIGEHGGTYYAGPDRTVEIGGERPYESYDGRNEALAFDLYRMITEVAQPDLAFFSPSELVWFGLEQLPFGYETTKRPPNQEDGVFFSYYEENTPGVQLERLPPYVMTINPGLDDSLPAYEPMAMFEAMKAALDPRGPQPSEWASMPLQEEYPSHPTVNEVPGVGFVGDVKGELFNQLYLMGVPLVIGESAGEQLILVVDADSAQGATRVVANRQGESVLKRGGRVWLMAGQGAGALPEFSWLDHEISLTERSATALVPDRSQGIVAGFKPSDLYFVVDDGDSQILKAGLDVADGEILLTASNSDWSLFNRQPEPVKCSSMLIYERLEKPAGAALVSFKQGNGDVWISTLDASLSSAAAEVFWSQLWTNSGVHLVAPVGQWYIKGGANEQSVWQYTTKEPSDGWQYPAFDDRSWSAGSGGFGTNPPKSQTRTEWTTNDIYLRQIFTLEKGKLPEKLTMTVYHDEAVTVYLNGEVIYEDAGTLTNYRQVPLDTTQLSALKPGENLIAVHCHQTVGGQYIDFGLYTEASAPRTHDAKHNLLLDGPVH
jgi:beta-galactosidase